MNLFSELFLSPSKVHGLLIIIFYQFQLILAYYKALNVLISTTSHLYFFYCKFPFNPLIQIAKSSTTRDFSKLGALILFISLLRCS